MLFAALAREQGRSRINRTEAIMVTRIGRKLLFTFTSGALLCANAAGGAGYVPAGTAYLAAGTSYSAGGTGYLVKVGPKPLRFQVSTPQLDPAKVLPALRMSDDPVPPISMPSPEIYGPQQEQIVSTGEPDPGTTTAAPIDTSTFIPVPPPNTNFPSMTPPRDAQITPQMLLRFFNQGTNEVAVPAPVEFTPPFPGPRNSSATYISK
jgi:hypothetical protein